MNEDEINLLANKVADILVKRYEGKEAAISERVADLYWNTPLYEARPADRTK